MSLLDALNRLNETDESLEIEEKETEDASITENGNNKQAIIYILFMYKFIYILLIMLF